MRWHGDVVGADGFRLGRFEEGAGDDVDGIGVGSELTIWFLLAMLTKMRAELGSSAMPLVGPGSSMAFSHLVASAGLIQLTQPIDAAESNECRESKIIDFSSRRAQPSKQE